ncbi:MAG: hypothetical protein QME96_16550, partial [Myxococcota bacterium]|nr:hypothetical protein [Myxococcota bacterium]
MSAPQSRPAAIECPLCGRRLTEAEMNLAALPRGSAGGRGASSREAADCPPVWMNSCRCGCPAAGECRAVRCPGCGTEFPLPGPVTKWLARLLRGKGTSRQSRE